MEIERKWLVDKNLLPFELKQYKHTNLFQSYIEFSPTVRIRNEVENNRYILTEKSKSLDGGLSREEHEHDISREEYERLRKQIKGVEISKTRYYVPVNVESFEKLVYEIDAFHGELEGLFFAEVEFPDIDTARSFPSPEWVVKEVTGDKGYSNSSLAKYGRIVGDN